MIEIYNVPNVDVLFCPASIGDCEGGEFVRRVKLFLSHSFIRENGLEEVIYIYGQLVCL